MDEGGNTKDDLSLPSGTDDANKLADQLKSDFEAGKELVVTVLKVYARSDHGRVLHTISFPLAGLLLTGAEVVKLCARPWERR